MLLSSKHLALDHISKFKPRFVGPFAVVERIGPAAYKLQLQGRYKQVHPVFHVSLLRPHVAGGPSAAPPLPILRDGEEEWAVEGIQRHRRRGGCREYLVRYEGYDASEDQWLDEEDLSNAKDILDKYKAEHGLT